MDPRAHERPRGLPLARGLVRRVQVQAWPTLLEWSMSAAASGTTTPASSKPTVRAELRRVAEPLRGARVLHPNATRYGGGVSELVRSVVPLLNGLSLVADWKVVHDRIQGSHRARVMRSHYASERGSARVGSVKWKLVVSPGVLSTQMRPRCASTRPLQM
jgi:hypothetical protein